MSPEVKCTSNSRSAFEKLKSSMDPEAVSSHIKFGDIDDEEKHQVGEEFVAELDLNGQPFSEENIDVPRSVTKKLKIGCGQTVACCTM